MLASSAITKQGTCMTGIAVGMRVKKQSTATHMFSFIKPHTNNPQSRSRLVVSYMSTRAHRQCHRALQLERLYLTSPKPTNYTIGRIRSQQVAIARLLAAIRGVTSAASLTSNVRSTYGWRLMRSSHTQHHLGADSKGESAEGENETGG